MKTFGYILLGLLAAFLLYLLFGKSKAKTESAGSENDQTGSSELEQLLKLSTAPASARDCKQTCDNICKPVPGGFLGIGGRRKAGKQGYRGDRGACEKECRSSCSSGGDITGWMNYWKT